MRRFTLRPGIPVPPIYWTIDGERDFPLDFADYTAASNDRFSRVTSPLAQGAHAIRFDLHDGDASYASSDFSRPPGTANGPFGERAEIATAARPKANNDRELNVGDDVWLGFQIRIPSAFPLSVDGSSSPTWCIVSQWKQVGGMGVPAMCLKCGFEGPSQGGLTPLQPNTNEWQFWSADVQGDSLMNSAKWHGAVTPDIWTRFLMHARFHTDPTIGFVELYGDLTGSGVISPLMARRYMLTMKYNDPTLTQANIQIRIGMYRDPAISGDATLYYDGYTVGQTRAQVEANAWGP